MKCHAKVGGRPGKPAYRTPSTFQAKVYAVVKKIPKGETMTYKQVAQHIDQPRAYRAVGNALNKNYDPAIPCHRVVRSDGTIGGYNRGSQKKKDILAKEKDA
ncbi:MAG: MGMT family protein [Parcubacteria group bacterium]|jgi:O-6-methylguanine DNA methyltransferase